MDNKSICPECGVNVCRLENFSICPECGTKWKQEKDLTNNTEKGFSLLEAKFNKEA